MQLLIPADRATRQGVKSQDTPLNAMRNIVDVINLHLRRNLEVMSAQK